jgi:hypothetical protein
MRLIGNGVGKMKFLCVGYFNPDKMEARPKEEIDAIMGKCEPHLNKFYKSGQMMMDAGVDLDVKHLSRVGGKVRVTDGAPDESKERIGSVFMIEAEDMEDAVRVASLHPTVQVDEGEELDWRLEVRPVHYFKNS